MKGASRTVLMGAVLMIVALGAVALLAVEAPDNDPEPTPTPSSEVSATGTAESVDPSTGTARVPVPAEIIDPPWLEARRQAQLDSAKGLGVFHSFRFRDALERSGIGFRHRVVDDAGRTYKAVHYDHGSGVAVADVDGDGRHDIYFVNQVGGNELWRNLGSGRFENITAAAGVAVADRIGVTASFADIDNDGDADLYVTAVRKGNVLLENDGAGHFKDVSAASGLDHAGHSSAAVFFDYNRDGLLDVFLTNVGQYTTETVRTATGPAAGGSDQDTGYKFYDGLEDAFGGHLKPPRYESSILFKNAGGNRFVDVSSDVGLVDTSWSGDASPIDANEDGWPDLYVLNMQGHDQYYENVAGKRFAKKSREVFPKTPFGSMGIKVFDFDNDGDMDILITDMHSDMSEQIGVEREKLKSRMRWPESFLRTGGASIYGNAFYKNEGGGKFDEVSDEIGAENYWPWGCSVGDLNADGYEDVFIASSMNYPFRYGVNTVLLNVNGERFADSEFILGVEPRRNHRTATLWFELDCEGADKTHEICRTKSGRVEVWGALGSRSSVLFDLDDDGDLDIVTNDFNSEPLVLISDLSERKGKVRYLKIDLVGKKSNRDGLGARVTVKTSLGTYAKVYDGQSGYLSQSSLPLYFGLAAAEKIEAVEVVWPSGRTQHLPRPIAMSSRVQIHEDSGAK